VHKRAEEIKCLFLPIPLARRILLWTEYYSFVHSRYLVDVLVLLTLETDRNRSVQWIRRWHCFPVVVPAILLELSVFGVHKFVFGQSPNVVQVP